MRSDNVTKGSERAPNRSLFYALGYTPEELERPLIGVVSAHSEIVPGHMNLDKIADAVKAGIEMAGGTPILIPAIGVCEKGATPSDPFWEKAEGLFLQAIFYYVWLEVQPAKRNFVRIGTVSLKC